MPEASGAALSVSALFAERDSRRRHDREAEEQLQQRKEEELAEFKKRLDNFQLTDAIVHSGLDRIKRAFERGETELMISSFPSSFCTDGGRAIINAGAPPINKPSREATAALALDLMVQRVQQVMRQTKARIFLGGTRSAGKIVSIFEPSTEVIRKGKASKPTEFGKLVKLQEAENQIVIGIGLSSNGVLMLGLLTSRRWLGVAL